RPASRTRCGSPNDSSPSARTSNDSCANIAPRGDVMNALTVFKFTQTSTSGASSSAPAGQSANSSGAGATSGDQMVSSSPSSSASSDPFLDSLDSILNDSSLSVEDKITALLMKLMEKMDSDIETQLDHVRSLQTNGSQSGSTAGGTGAANGAAAGS